MPNKNTSVALLVAGLALVVGFFLPWFGPFSGWDIVRNEDVPMFHRVLFSLCPLLGLGLATSALLGSRRTALVAVAAGVGVLGYTGYKVADTFLAITGWGLWIILAAAVVALIAGLAGSAARRP